MDILRKIYSPLLAILSVGVIVFSCCEIPPDTPVDLKRVVLLYVAGNNNLSPDLRKNVQDIEKGYIPSYNSGEVLLSFVHLQGEVPRLIKFEKNKAGSIIRDTIVEYTNTLVSSAANVLRMILEDTKERYPCDDYSLILSSHATGWVPNGAMHSTSSKTAEVDEGIDPYAGMVKSFGADDKSSTVMELKEMKNAIPYHLSLIMFDACFMGGVEVAYELKDRCDYLIAAPSEILSAGFPYDKIMDHFFSTPQNLAKVCEEYFNLYNGQTGEYRSATVGLYKTSELANLASVAGEIFEKYRSEIQLIDRNDIQRYYRTFYYNAQGWFWDLGDFVERLTTAEEYATFEAALNKVVVSKYTTERFIDIPIVKYSGLSVYIPTDNDTYIESRYKELDWNRDTGLVQ